MPNLNAWSAVESAQVKAIQLQSLLDVYTSTFMDVSEKEFKLIAEMNPRQMSDLANLAFDLVMQINKDLSQAINDAYAQRPEEKEAVA